MFVCGRDKATTHDDRLAHRYVIPPSIYRHQTGSGLIFFNTASVSPLVPVVC
jgi:hypothetical protein